MKIFDELEEDARNLMERVTASIKTALLARDSWIHYDEFEAERRRFSTLTRCFKEASEVYSDARTTGRFGIGDSPRLGRKDRRDEKETKIHSARP